MPSLFVSSNGDPSDARSETCHPLWDVATIFRTSGCPPVFRTLIAAVTVCPGVTLKYGPAATKTPAGGTKVVALVADEAEGRLTEFAMMVATSALPSTAAAGTSTVAVRVMAPFDGIGPVSGTPSPFVSVTAEPFAYQRDVGQANGAELHARLNVSCGSAIPRFTTLKS